VPHRSDGSETVAGKRGSARQPTASQIVGAAITDQKINYTIVNGTTGEDLSSDSSFKTKIKSGVPTSGRTLHGRSTSR